MNKNRGECFIISFLGNTKILEIVYSSYIFDFASKNIYIYNY